MPLPGIAVLNPTFNPSLSAITAITPVVDPTRGNVTFIDTQSPHTFVTGQIIKILVPSKMRATMTSAAYDYGMPEINERIVTVIGINALFPNRFLIAVDSRQYQPFVLPAAPTQFAQAIPVGEVNSKLNGAERNVLRPA